MAQIKTAEKTGSSKVQGEIWGSRARAWAELGEPTSLDLFKKILTEIKTNGKTIKLLDIGCGSGLFCEMAYEKGIDVIGFDASANLLEIARERLPNSSFFEGDMENLPFTDNSFDVVTGINAFQFAANRVNAMKEAYRVTKPDGYIIAATWGMPEDSQITPYMNAMKELMPPPPPGTPPPVILAEPGVFEKLVYDGGFKAEERVNVRARWWFKNEEEMLKGLTSAGMIAIAINHSGEDKVNEAVRRSLAPFKKQDGTYELYNTFIYVKGIK